MLPDRLGDVLLCAAPWSESSPPWSGSSPPWSGVVAAVVGVLFFVLASVVTSVVGVLTDRGRARRHRCGRRCHNLGLPASPRAPGSVRSPPAPEAPGRPPAALRQPGGATTTSCGLRFLGRHRFGCGYDPGFGHDPVVSSPGLGESRRCSGADPGSDHALTTEASARAKRTRRISSGTSIVALSHQQAWCSVWHGTGRRRRRHRYSTAPAPGWGPHENLTQVARMSTPNGVS